jgi:hypothetical protein
MIRLRTVLLSMAVLGSASAVILADNVRDLRADLSGYEEVPTLSTSGHGRFQARVNKEDSEVEWRLSYADTESAVTQAHIHFAARALNGQIVVFLCSNLGNGPAGTQPCPAAPATIEGTFSAVDVLGNAAAMGLEAGNLEELLAAIRAGATYANVHTTGRPGGEVRGQIDAHDHGNRPN